MRCPTILFASRNVSSVVCTCTMTQALAVSVLLSCIKPARACAEGASEVLPHVGYDLHVASLQKYVRLRKIKFALKVTKESESSSELSVWTALGDEGLHRRIACRVRE